MLVRRNLQILTEGCPEPPPSPRALSRFLLTGTKGLLASATSLSVSLAAAPAAPLVPAAPAFVGVVVAFLKD